MATAVGDLIVNLSARTGQYDKAMRKSRDHLGRFTAGNKTAAASSAQFSRGVTMSTGPLARFAASANTATASSVVMGRSVSGSFAMIGAAAKTLWVSLAPILGPLVGIYGFYRLAAAGEEFNAKMRNAQAIMGDLSNAMKRTMRDTAIQVAGDLNFATSEMADGFYFLQSAGLNVQQQLLALRPVAEFARAGMFDLGRATELAAGSQSAMGMKSENAKENLRNLTRVTDVLVKGNTLANATVEELARALGTDAANAGRMAGQSIEEVVGVLLALADKMVKGEKAGTAYARAINYLGVQAVENEKAFERAGVRMFDATDKTRKLVDVIADLERRFSGMSDKQRTVELQSLGFTKKTIALMNTLIGTSDAIRDYTKGLNEAGTTSKEVAEKQLTPFQRGWGKLRASISLAGSELMDWLGPKLGAAASGLSTLYGYARSTTAQFSAFFETIRQSPVGEFIRQFIKVATIGGILLTLIPIAFAVKVALMTAFSVVTGPLGAFIAMAGIAGSVLVELTGKGETFGEKLDDVLSRIPDLIDGLAFTFRNFSAIAQVALIDIVQQAVKSFPQMQRPLEHVAAFFMGTFAGIKAFFGSILQNIIGGLKEVANLAKAVGAGLMAAFEAIRRMEFRDVAKRFGEAFVEELASQADAKAPNAFKEFGSAFDKAAAATRGKIQKAGGLSKMLDQQKSDLLAGIAHRESTLKEAAEKTKDAMVQGSKAISDAQQDGLDKAKDIAQGPSRFAAALTEGSTEAYSAIVKAMAAQADRVQAAEDKGPGKLKDHKQPREIGEPIRNRVPPKIQEIPPEQLRLLPPDALPFRVQIPEIPPDQLTLRMPTIPPEDLINRPREQSEAAAGPDAYAGILAASQQTAEATKAGAQHTGEIAKSNQRMARSLEDIARRREEEMGIPA